MPRFRAEVGPFIGIAGSLDARYLDGGYTGLESGSGYMGGARPVSARRLWTRGSARRGGRRAHLSLAGLPRRPALDEQIHATARLPSKAARWLPRSRRVPDFQRALRLPFYLVPGDLLLLSPLYFIAPGAYENIAVTAVNGGLIPWQLGWATRFGRFQFVLGREIGAAFYGLGRTDTLLVPGVTPDAGPRVVSVKSTSLDFPILEYRPYRAFDMTQTSELRVQFFFGVDIPHGGSVVSPPGAPGVQMQRVYSVGARAVFDWRRYF